MSVTVKVAINLRRLTGGAPQIQVEGDTAQEALTNLSQQYTELGKQLFAADGTRRQVVGVYVNGEEIRYRQGMATPLSPGDEILLLSAVAGG